MMLKYKSIYLYVFFLILSGCAGKGIYQNNNSKILTKVGSVRIVDNTVMSTPDEDMEVVLVSDPKTEVKQWLRDNVLPGNAGNGILKIIVDDVSFVTKRISEGIRYRMYLVLRLRHYHNEKKSNTERVVIKVGRILKAVPSTIESELIVRDMEKELFELLKNNLIKKLKLYLQLLATP